MGYFFVCFLLMPGREAFAQTQTTARLLFARLLIFRAVDLNQAPVLQAYGAQLAAPDAAGVQAEQGGSVQQAQRGPVAKDDGHVVAGPIRQFIPGEQARIRVGRAFVFEVHAAVRPAHAHARQAADDGAPPVFAA